jgi:hypothetical protein
MKKSTKAALLSALVFPGVGHFYLKKYIPGVVLFSISAAGLCLIISKTVERVLQMVEKAVEPDVAAIMQAVSSQTDSAYLLEIASAIFMICWVIGIIDSYMRE